MLKLPLVLLASAAALMLAALAHAQPAAGVAASTAPITDQAAAAGLADGEIRKVDKDNKKLTLKHGPLKNLDMPSMTMVFQVKDDAMLD